MPSPPPNGRSSTVRWRSCVKLRRSCVAICTRPVVRVRFRIPKSNGPEKKSGKIVMMSKRIDDKCGTAACFLTPRLHHITWKAWSKATDSKRRSHRGLPVLYYLHSGCRGETKE